MGVLNEIMAERQRQIDNEHFFPSGDDGYLNGELAKAASCYALNAGIVSQLLSQGFDIGQIEDMVRAAGVPELWPWGQEWFTPKPRDRRRDLVRAGALIVAEIERLDRLAARR